MVRERVFSIVNTYVPLGILGAGKGFKGTSPAWGRLGPSNPRILEPDFRIKKGRPSPDLPWNFE